MLLSLAALAIVFLIALITWFRLHAFIALILTALVTGLAAGKAPSEVLQSIQTGISGTLGGVTLVIGFGMLLGSLLSETGGTTVISERLLKIFGPEKSTWALALTGFVLGLAMFYNAGFVVLAPLVFSVAAQTRQSLVPLAIAMAAPLSVTHCFLPPHPGATAVANVLGADIGRTLLLGLLIGMPAIVMAGVVFPASLKNITATPPKGIFSMPEIKNEERPPFILAILVALLPVLLMAVATISELTLPQGHTFRIWANFMGDSGMAMLAGVLAALLLLIVFRGKPVGPAIDKSAGSLGAIAPLLLIIAAGGAFKQVLLDTGISRELTDQLSGMQASPLLLGWLIATVLRVAIGSATVAGMTAAGIALPLLQDGSNSPELMALAIGAGSVMFSHVNDTGFWMFKEWFGLSIRDTFRSWTLMETLIGIYGLAGVLLLDIWL